MLERRVGIMAIMTELKAQKLKITGETGSREKDELETIRGTETGRQEAAEKLQVGT